MKERQSTRHPFLTVVGFFFFYLCMGDAFGRGVAGKVGSVYHA